MKFNDEQLSIIDRRQGAVLVSAPVGTGKTTVLVERVARAIESGIKPSDILSLTFTNRAAEEMKSRLKVRLDNPSIYNELVVTTFHGFCASFLRQERSRLGLSNDFSIADEVEQVEIMNRLLVKVPNYQESNKRQTFQIIDTFYHYQLNALESKYGFTKALPPLTEPWRTVFEQYYYQLSLQNSLDFNQLVVETLRALYEDKLLLDKWSQRFQLIQLDEFQDTHFSEYLIVKQLARQHKNIALIGDFAQMIYGWRGSQPQVIAGLFKTHFAPVSELSLTNNYRSKPDLLLAAQQILAGHKGDGVNKSISIVPCTDQASEAEALIAEIKRLKAEGGTDKSLAVLLRTNSHITRLAEYFTASGIAFLTVDQYNFFRRQEVRDAYSWLKLLTNRHDTDSLRRVSLRPGKKVTAAVVEAVNKAGTASGLKGADFLDFSNYRYTEPFAELISTWKTGRIVVLDTETTGTDTREDEIVQVYAQEIIAGKPGKSYHAYLKPVRLVGSSYYVHRLTDDFLRDNGREPAEVLTELKDFVNDALIVGHNVNFDIAILEANSARHNLVWSAIKYFDTLDIARRWVVASNYRLSTLATQLNLASATHSADDDVAATIDLLTALMPVVMMGAKARADLFATYSKQFIGFATDLARWRMSAKSKRPSEILAQVLEESGLENYYQHDSQSEKRLESLTTLKQLFAEWDDLDVNPETALIDVLARGTLARNIDFLGLEGGKVPIVTIHQVKGLEFDYVLMPQMNEGQLPSGGQNMDLEEEKRVFYVGVTRAKSAVYLSYSLQDNYGRKQIPSRFLDFLA